MDDLFSHIETDWDFYRATHTDLAQLDDTQCARHYAEHGYNAGRIAHPRAKKNEFIEPFRGKRALEIGPYVNPCLTGPSTRYLDVLSTEGLAARAAKMGLSTERLPEIHYVSTDCTMACVDERFEVLFSAHNLEHQPDLISHLREAARLLEPGGTYGMIVPNAKYCFDALLPLSTIAAVFDAYTEKRRRHTLGTIVRHRAMTTHNNSAKHWKQSWHRSYTPLDPERVKAALAEFENADGAYIDAHAWQFDPLSLSDILRTLIATGHIPFTGVTCHGPVRGRNEFTVMLQK
ncbi:class I SAM-dependent methyltransferase [Vannielia sp. SX4]|uniref:class I SAM-dependent methyltransferase n=1 Tax=Vannielia sp. SX4 TaxID=3463852 RepID=UPI00405913C4